jgi:hypothetical protein
MAEDEELAGAAGRLEAALNRIARATSNRSAGATPGDGKMDIVAERLDALILELRSALEQGHDETS